MALIWYFNPTYKKKKEKEEEETRGLSQMPNSYPILNSYWFDKIAFAYTKSKHDNSFCLIGTTKSKRNWSKSSSCSHHQPPKMLANQYKMPYFNLLVQC